MNKRCIKFRDTWAAPGSQLFEALEAGDTARADSIYTECEIALLRSYGIPDHHMFEVVGSSGKIRLFSKYERKCAGLRY